MLSEEGRAILDFERAAWTQPGPKDEVIETELGLTALAYYERLRLLIATRSAFEYDPLTTKRVLRLIEEPIDSELAV